MKQATGQRTTNSQLHEERSEDLVAEVCAELGFTAEDAQLILDGQSFVSPAGLICRFQVDVVDGQSGLRPELELPLLIEDLESPQIAALLDLQTVLTTTMGWAVSVGANEGPLCLSTLQAASTAKSVVQDLETGNLLAVSVLQMLISDSPESLQAFGE